MIRQIGGYGSRYYFFPRADWKAIHERDNGLLLRIAQRRLSLSGPGLGLASGHQNISVKDGTPFVRLPDPPPWPDPEGNSRP